MASARTGGNSDAAQSLWCADCKKAPPAVTMDPGERWQREVCVDCADDELERLNTPRWFLEHVQEVREEAEWRPRPVRLLDWETCDVSKLNSLNSEWEEFVVNGRRVTRCWALTSRGRCPQRELEQGLCAHHTSVGARIPGLGWSRGVPQGPILGRRGRSSEAA